MVLSADRDLPEELLAEIISRCSTSTLAALCRVCKRMNRIATSILYTSVTVSPNRFPESGTATLLPFAYLIFTSQTHASVVKSIEVSQALGDGGTAGLPLLSVNDKDQPWPLFGTPELKRVLRKKCDDYTDNEAEANDMYDQLEDGGNEDGIFALLLASLPNLQKLDVDVGEMVDHDAFHSLIERITDKFRTDERNKDPEHTPKTSFLAPIDVMVKADADKYPNEPVQLIPYFRLPNLRSIYGITMGNSEYDNEENSAFASLKPRSCPVEYIELRCSKLAQWNFQHIFNATIPGRLKTFNYEVGCSWAWCRVDHQSMIRSLEAHYDTLDSLGLSHEDFYPYQEPADAVFEGDEDQPFAVTFTCFKSLTRLKVAPVYIWGHAGFQHQPLMKLPETREMLWKALPGSLEELWITRAWHQAMVLETDEVVFESGLLIPALDLVLANKAEAFPKLAKITIHVCLIQWKETALEVLGDFCARAIGQGVDCIVIVDNLNDEAGDPDDLSERNWGWNEDVEWQMCMFNEDGPRMRIVTCKEEDVRGRLKCLKSEIEDSRKRSS